MTVRSYELSDGTLVTVEGSAKAVETYVRNQAMTLNVTEHTETPLGRPVMNFAPAADGRDNGTVGGGVRNAGPAPANAAGGDPGDEAPLGRPAWVF